MPRILIVEDEARVASFLEKGLRANGFATTVVGAGTRPCPWPGTGSSTSSSSISASLGRRSRRCWPGCEVGADDYLTKPFHFHELLARIRARLRDGATPGPRAVHAGEMADLDLRARRAIVPVVGPETRLGVPPVRRWCRHPVLTASLALTLTAGIWLGLPGLGASGRVALIGFGLAIIGWVLTDLDDTMVALAAALVLFGGGGRPADVPDLVANPTIWLLVGTFVVSEAVRRSGLTARLVVAVASRARSVSQLCYLLTAALLVTPFVIPATAGRAALMVSVFLALSRAIDNHRVGRVLALLIPTIILLSAVASLTGAGAHLVTAQIVEEMGGGSLGYARWLVLGLPFAAVSSFVSCWVILRLFLTPKERRRPLSIGPLQASTEQVGGRGERLVAGAVAGMVLGWATEPLHGVDHALVALLGAAVVTAPRVGVLSLREALGSIQWSLLAFLAATLVLGQALSRSGAVEWLVDGAFSRVGGSPFAVAAAVVGVSLLAHLLVTSRTARSSVLIPLVVVLGLSRGYDPAAVAFLSNAAAGFCLTFPVSAKPVAIFARLDGPTYSPGDLLHLSSVLLPVHFGLLLGFAFTVWPALGLALA